MYKLITLILSLSFLLSNAQIVFVKKEALGLNNGTSWNDAYTDLDFAIEQTDSAEIWVASGIYTPSSDINGSPSSIVKNHTFKLKKNIAIYGGFLGNETLKTQRDWINNLTVLSGDIGVIGDVTDNINHVVTAEPVLLDSNSKLDGLIISDGYTESNSPNRNGAGIYMFYVRGGDVVIRNCIIQNNRSFGEGGGIYIRGYSPILENNIIRQNEAYNGAGIYIYYSDAILKNNIIRYNFANDFNVFIPSGSGGGIYISSYSSPILTKNIIESNFSDGNGGGVTIDSNEPAVFESNLILLNTSKLNGGGIYLNYSDSFFFNNIFAKNNAKERGGAMYVDYNPEGIKFINNTVTLNSSILGGGALYLYSSDANIVNSIIYGNTPRNNQINLLSLAGNRAPSFRYCNIEFGSIGIRSVGNQFVYQNNLDTLPMFEDITLDRYNLNTYSPLINSGTDSLSVINSGWNGAPVIFPNTDFSGNPRIFEQIDIGAFEYPYPVGIKESELSKSVIYPNPTNGILEIDTEINDYSIDIYNITGKLIRHYNQKTRNSNIDLSGHEYGIYLIIIKSDDVIQQHKIVLSN